MDRRSEPLLLGRGPQLAMLDERIARVVGGAGLAVMVVGGPGRGKSALLREVTRRWTPALHLHATGYESEADLAFVTLRDLLRPVLDRIGRLPEPQAEALRAAVTIGGTSETSRLAVFAGTLGLIEDACIDGPVLVSIDDLHWADRSSIDVLRYVMRRVPRGCLVIGTRNEGRIDGLDLAVEEIELPPLDIASSVELLQRLGALAPQVARRVAEECSGNPYALEVTHGLLDDRQRWGVAPVDQLSGEAVQRVVDRQLRRFAPATIEALAATALSLGSPSLPDALRRLGSSVDALDDAIVRGVLSVQDGTYRFASPVLRSAAAAALSASRRAEVLGVLAEHDVDPERRAWLTALAARGADEDAATALTSLGMRYAHAGGVASALEAFRAAVGISAPAQRAGRCVLVAETALSAGRFDVAAAMAVEVRSDAFADADASFRIDLVDARLRAAIGDPSAGRLLHDVALRLDAVDRVAADDLRMWAAMSTFTRGDVATARHWQQQVDALAPAQPPSAHGVGAVRPRTRRDLLGVMLDVFSGDLRDVDDVAASVDSGTDARAYERRPLWSDTTLAQILVWSNRHETARRHIGHAIDAARRHGDLTALPFLLAVDADLRYRTGEWDRGVASAMEAVEVARASDNVALLTFALVMAGRARANRGDTDGCEELVREGHGLAEQLGLGSVGAYAAATRGRCALFDGRLDVARSELVEATRRLDVADGRNPWVTDHLPDLIDVAHALGDIDLLHDAATRLRAVQPGDRLSTAIALRAEGLAVEADDPSSAAVRLERSLSTMSGLSVPLELARAHSHLARVRTDLGQSALADDHRERSQRWTAELGLRAVGSVAPIRPTAPSGSAALRRATPRERDVAGLVAAGRTNKEIAGELGMSVKTVEHHLRQLFRHVGVSSRTQLAAIVIEERRG